MPRLDRLLTLNIITPMHGLGNARRPAVPVLMYHSISDEQENGHPYYWINTGTMIFAEHMRFLSAHGYRTIGLHELASVEPDGKSVVITFDDGFGDFYHKALPVLNEHYFSATVFLATAYIGGELFKGKPCLNWDQIRELGDAGITFGSHTHTHPRLWTLSRQEIVEELRRSKLILEDKLGSAVNDFSCPYRFPEENRRMKRLIADEIAHAGYTRCVTTIIGRYRKGDDLMLIKRLPVNTADDESFLDAKLRGNYDWLHTPQYLCKRVRSMIE